MLKMQEIKKGCIAATLINTWLSLWCHRESPAIAIGAGTHGFSDNRLNSLTCCFSIIYVRTFFIYSLLFQNKKWLFSEKNSILFNIKEIWCYNKLTKPKFLRLKDIDNENKLSKIQWKEISIQAVFRFWDFISLGLKNISC